MIKSMRGFLGDQQSYLDGMGGTGGMEGTGGIPPPKPS